MIAESFTTGALSEPGSALPIGPLANVTPRADLVCFSHLRWDFVFQRPQHLLTRFAKERHVYFFEEPIFVEASAPSLEERGKGPNLTVLVPRLVQGQPPSEIESTLKALLDGFFAARRIQNPILWYYTPMAFPWSAHISAAAVIYDCMDELSHFKGAPPQLRSREAELLARADVVFTGGQSLYEAKRDQHPNIHPMPSSVDALHFRRARLPLECPADQKKIPLPRIGFFGVIDERLDVDLLHECARLRPSWHFVLLGPVVKIDPTSLPEAPNIHYLGPKRYEELPAYLAGWQVATLPFARNDATRFISPTKTPEYLSAGRPVVSTSIRDVVRPYGDMGLVRIADTPEEFVRALELSLSLSDRTGWLQSVDGFLATTSWDSVWTRMNHVIRDAVAARVPERARA